MKLILNKTTKSSDRLTLIEGAFGNAGDPQHYPTHKFVVVTGVNRGNGYQGYMSVTYALTECGAWMPSEARLNLIRFLVANGFAQYIVDLMDKASNKKS